MADTLEGLRSQLITSIYGRRLGLDIGETLVGPNDIRKPVTAATSLTTATAISAYGFTTVASASAGTGFTLAAPVPGVVKYIASISTGGASIVLASGNFRSLNGSSAGSVLSSTYNTLTFTAASSGVCAQLVGVSTLIWQAITPFSSGISFI